LAAANNAFDCWNGQAIDERGTSGMFLCPGWSRDFYVGSIFGQIARVYVEADGGGPSSLAAKI
jgi:hypothetical protein